MVGSDQREIHNRLAVVCEHLLKRQFQPDQRSGSWCGSVVEQRARIAGLIAKSPSLASHPASVLIEAYTDGRANAAAESGLPGPPAPSPWTVAQLLDPEFWPDDPPRVAGVAAAVTAFALVVWLVPAGSKGAPGPSQAVHGGLRPLRRREQCALLFAAFEGLRLRRDDDATINRLAVNTEHQNRLLPWRRSATNAYEQRYQNTQGGSAGPGPAH